HGRIRTIDATAGRRRLGVHAVITAAEIGAVPTIPLRQESLPVFKRYEQPVIAVDKVRYVGEPIAVVLAGDAACAEDALESITVEIEPLPAVVDARRAKTGGALPFGGVGPKLGGTVTGRRGGTGAALHRGAHRPPRSCG